MKKVRYFLAAIALIATLGGFSLQGAGAMAHAASHQHVSSANASFALKPFGPCPGGGVYDC